MGGKSSKPQLRRTKSFYNVGRSTQRMQFQKFKAQLNQISRQIAELTPGGASESEIREKLETISRELNATSERLKEHNKTQYEEILKLLDSVTQSFHKKTRPESPSSDLEEVVLNEIADENSVAESGVNVELRRSASACNDVEHRTSTKETSIKFGIQVMPCHSQVGKDLLKRSTLPTNAAAKAEFENIRNTVPEVKPTNLANNNEKVRDNLNLTRSDLSVSTEFLNFVKNPLEETEIQVSAIKQIEFIGNQIARLEKEVLDFDGRRGDQKYFEVHDIFVKRLIELDQIESYGNPIIRQEKRMIIKRIQELLSAFKNMADRQDGRENEVQV